MKYSVPGRCLYPVQMNPPCSTAPDPSGQRRVLLLFDTGHAVDAAYLRGIVHYQRLHQAWAVFLDDSARTDRELVLLHSGRWHGVVSAHATPALALACAALQIPLIDLFDGIPLPGVLKIRPDNRAIGHLGAEHLMERRFRNFAFSGFRGLSWSVERRDGFQESLELAGHSCLVHETAPPDADSPMWDGGQNEMLGAWLRQLPRESAVMACNDNWALQLLRAAVSTGLDVPHDVAVLGVNNDTQWCMLATPEISSVAINSFEAGHCAAEQLDILMNGGAPVTRDFRIDPIGVVARQSTEVLSLRDHKVAAAIKYIQEHACRGITVDDVVREVHASRSQLESRFRRFIGRSPQAQIRHVQVDHIRHLLSTTDCSLKEIADQTGFAHVEYMCVLFKRLTGETMGQYRRDVRAQEQVQALA